MNSLVAFMRSALWWLVPLVALGAVVAYETDFGRALRKAPPRPVAVEPRPVTTALLPEYGIPGGVASRRETVERTLFTPTRRPAPALVAEAAKPRMQRGQFALTGTLIVDGKNTAFLREVNGGRSRRVVQGETINGLVVAEVKSDRVKLAMGDEVEELVLRVSTNPRPTPQPAVATAAPVPQPVVPQAVVPPVGTAAPVTQDVAAQTLAERRRAARAAQAAAQAQTSTPDGNPIPVPPPAAAGSSGGGVPAAQPPVPAAPPGRTSAATPDPSWNDVYQRYQYRTR